MDDLRWQADARCAETDPDLFVLELGKSGQNAKKICATCPVAAACLDWAQRNELNDGIYAGLTANQRRALRKVESEVTPVGTP